MVFGFSTFENFECLVYVFCDLVYGLLSPVSAMAHRAWTRKSSDQNARDNVKSSGGAILQHVRLCLVAREGNPRVCGGSKKGYPVALIQTMPGALQSSPWILIYPHDHPERVVASSSRGPVCKFVIGGQL